MREIDSDSFVECVFTQITIPEPVRFIYSDAFADCHNLKEVTIEGDADLKPGCFKNCGALENVIMLKGMKEFSMDAFENCTALKEIHLPFECETVEGTVPDGVTLFIQSERLAVLAIENGWNFRMENGTEVATASLSDAIKAGKITYEIDTSSVLKIHLRNASKEMLVVENISDAGITEGDRTYYFIGSGAEKGFLFGPGKTQDVFAEYYTAYGPEETTVQIAAESRYLTVRIFSGKLELSEEFLVAPHERKDLTLPSGTYRLRIAEGGTWISDEEAFGEDGKYSVIDYFDYEDV